MTQRLSVTDRLSGTQGPPPHPIKVNHLLSKHYWFFPILRTLPQLIQAQNQVRTWDEDRCSGNAWRGEARRSREGDPSSGHCLQGKHTRTGSTGWSSILSNWAITPEMMLERRLRVAAAKSVCLLLPDSRQPHPILRKLNPLSHPHPRWRRSLQIRLQSEDILGAIWYKTLCFYNMYILYFMFL